MARGEHPEEIIFDEFAIKKCENKKCENEAQGRNSCCLVYFHKGSPITLVFCSSKCRALFMNTKGIVR